MWLAHGSKRKDNYQKRLGIPNFAECLSNERYCAEGPGSGHLVSDFWLGPIRKG